MAGPELPPAAEELFRSQGFAPSQRVALLEGREVLSRARLGPVESAAKGARAGVQAYTLSNAMLVNAGVARTRDELTHFDRFAGMVPYIDRSDWDPKTRRLLISGAIWKYRLQALLQFRPTTADRWEFEIIEGHFLGMKGFMQFEAAGPARTLVVFAGRIEGRQFPPRFVIERGAEIVFAVTGRRVRSLVEAQTEVTDYGRSKAPQAEIPQPRRRL